jgi:hypothetical protein
MARTLGSAGNLDIFPPHIGGHESAMMGNWNGVGPAIEAQGAAAARSTQGRWPRICEQRRATGTAKARCAHVL